MVFVVMLSMMLTSMTSVSADDRVYVFDEAEVISKTAEDTLNTLGNDIYTHYDIHIAVCFIQTTEGAGTVAYGKDLYQAHFGDHNGLLLVYSIDDNAYTIIRSGDAKAYITDDQIKELWSTFTDCQYYSAGSEAFVQKAKVLYLEAKGVSEKTSSSKLKATKGSLLVDEADLLTDQQEQAVLERLTEVSSEQAFDIVIVFVNSLGGKTAMEFADDYFDDNGYGQGDDQDGILLLVSMEYRDWWISTSGYGITAFTDAGLEYIENHFVSYLSKGDYKKASLVFCDLCERFIKEARSNQPYDTGHMPKTFHMIFVVIAAIAGLVMAIALTLMKEVSPDAPAFVTEANYYIVPRSYHVLPGTNTLTGRTSHRVRHVVYESSSSSSRGSSHGGSSTHVSSSGHSHGGRGGKF